MKKNNSIPENEYSFLDKMDKTNHFSVPKNYFESLPEVINNKLLENKKIKNSFDILSWHVLAPSLSIIVLFIVILNYYTTDEEITLSNEELNEIIVDESYTEIDDYMVYETYAEILEDEEDNDNESEAEDYIDYLLENDIDINSIIEEL